MTYTYTYRCKDGSIAHGSIEAASRAEAFASLKSKAINPTALREGKDLPHPSVKVGIPRGAIYGVAALAVAVVGTLVWLWLRQVPEPVMDKTVGKPNSSQPAVKQTTAAGHEGSSPKNEKTASENVDSPSQQTDTPSKQPKIKAKNPAALLALQSSCKEGLDFSVDTNKVAELRRQNPTWTENKLQAQLTEYAIPGRFCGTPDPISDKEALALCDVKISDSEGDTDIVLAEKAAVRDLQKQLKEYLSGGGHANDFMMKLMERQDAEHEMMEQVKKQMTELCRSGDYDLAQEALDKYNAYLKDKGLPEIHTNPYMRHLLKVNAAAKQQNPSQN